MGEIHEGLVNNLHPDKFSIELHITLIVFCIGTADSWKQSSAKTNCLVLLSAFAVTGKSKEPTRCNTVGFRAIHPATFSPRN